MVENNEDGADAMTAINQFAGPRGRGKPFPGLSSTIGSGTSRVKAYAGQGDEVRLLVMFAGIGSNGQPRIFAKTFFGTHEEVNQAAVEFQEQHGRTP